MVRIIVVVMMLMMVTGLSYQTGTKVWLVCCWFSWMPWHHSRLYSLWFIQPTVLRSGSHLYLCFIAIFGKPTMHLIYIGKFLVSCPICIPSVCDIRQLGEGYNHTSTLPHCHTATLPHWHIVSGSVNIWPCTTSLHFACSPLCARTGSLAKKRWLPLF